MYILKYYTKSKYFGFERVNYKEFKDYNSLINYVIDNSLMAFDYEVFKKVEKQYKNLYNK